MGSDSTSLRKARAASLGGVVGLGIDQLSWTEVRDAISAGCTTVILVAASIEQHGTTHAMRCRWPIRH